MTILLLVLLGAHPVEGTARPGEDGGPRTLWLRVFSTARLAEAQRVQRILVAPGPEGGRLRQVFLRRGTGPEGTTVFEVLSGPFEATLEAVLHGLRLRGDALFARQGVRLDGLAVLLPTSFVPLPLRLGEAAVERLNPGGKQPYPVLGDLLVARALAFDQPGAALPAIEHATARLEPFTPIFLLGDRMVCAPAGRPCLRWFEVLHPTLIQTAWIPANQVARRRDLRAMELAEGTGRTKARGGLWPIGEGSSGTLYALVFRRGRLPPMRLVVTLTDRQGPPFRIVADRHGPGIYNREGKVVLRPTLAPWIYQRPPLWQVPTHVQEQLRREAHPRRAPAPAARPPTPATRDRPRAGPMAPDVMNRPRARPAAQMAPPRPRAMPRSGGR